MAKIWRAFQNKLAKLLEFSLAAKKKIPFFCSEKEHYLFMANGTFFSLCAIFVMVRIWRTFQKNKKKTSKTS